MRLSFSEQETRVKLVICWPSLMKDSLPSRVAGIYSGFLYKTGETSTTDFYTHPIYSFDRPVCIRQCKVDQHSDLSRAPTLKFTAMTARKNVHPRLAPLFHEYYALLSNPLYEFEFDTKFVDELRTLFPESVSLDRSEHLVRLADSVKTIRSGIRQVQTCASFDIFALCAAASLERELLLILASLAEPTSELAMTAHGYDFFDDTPSFGAEVMVLVDKMAEKVLLECEDLTERMNFKGGITSEQFTQLIQDIINKLEKDDRPKTLLKDDLEYQARLRKYLAEE